MPNSSDAFVVSGGQLLQRWTNDYNVLDDSTHRRFYGAPTRPNQPGTTKGATNRLTAHAYWKFESISLQRSVNKLSVPLAFSARVTQ